MREWVTKYNPFFFNSKLEQYAGVTTICGEKISS
jgi:hypothetical protein